MDRKLFWFAWQHSGPCNFSITGLCRAVPGVYDTELMFLQPSENIASDFLYALRLFVALM